LNRTSYIAGDYSRPPFYPQDFEWELSAPEAPDGPETKRYRVQLDDPVYYLEIRGEGDVWEVSLFKKTYGSSRQHTITCTSLELAKMRAKDVIPEWLHGLKGYL